MSQFCAYRVPGDRLVLDLQTDLIDTGTRVVAPLTPVQTSPKGLTRLEPVFRIGDTDYLLRTAELAAIPSGLLRDPPVANLSAYDYVIKGALDMVFSGF